MLFHFILYPLFANYYLSIHDEIYPEPVGVATNTAQQRLSLVGLLHHFIPGDVLPARTVHTVYQIISKGKEWYAFFGYKISKIGLRLDKLGFDWLIRPSSYAVDYLFISVRSYSFFL